VSPRTMKRSFRSKRGSVLLVALAFATIIAIALTSYMQMSRTAMQVSQRGFLANDAMNMTEAVLEQTLWSFNQSNTGNTSAWSNWSAGNANSTDDKQRTFASSTFTIGQGATATAKAYVKYWNSTGIPQPVVIAKTTVVPASGPSFTKEIEIYLTRRSFFSTGLVAKNGITFSGTNATVDSWNSNPNNASPSPNYAYNSTEAPRQAHGSIATTSITSTADVQNADIFGYVSVGSADANAIVLGSGGKITGNFSADNGTRDETRIATNFTADLPDVGLPATKIDSSGTEVAIASGDWNFYYTNPGHNNYITGAGHCTLPQPGDKAINIKGVTTYCYQVQYIDMAGNSSNQLIVDNVTSSGSVTGGYNVLIYATTTNASSKAVSTSGSGGITIKEKSTLSIYTAGNVDVTGDSTGNGGILNQNGQASGFQIWGTASSASSQSVQISGNGSLSAIVYAPNADVSIVGNGEVYGAMVGKTVRVAGNANFHYDESLASYGGNNPFKVASWRELRTPDEQATWSTVMSF
jgi:hypothetical protein